MSNHLDDIEFARQIIELAKGHEVPLPKIESTDNVDDLIHRLSDEERVSELMKLNANHDVKRGEARLVKAITQRKRRKNSYKIVSVAASILLIIAGTFYLTHNSPSIQLEVKPEVPILITENASHNLQELTPNQIVDLLSETTAELTNESTPEHEIANNLKVIIPKQFTYDLSLPDGSVVKINGGSSVQIPNKNAYDRVVILDGEAYFKVVKSDKPFIVRSKGSEIKVYGTEFNVRNYGSNTTQTVLVTGSVEVSTKLRRTMLTPGDCAVSDDSKNEIIVSKVQVENFLGWLDGSFFYTNRPMKDVVNDIMSWYDLEITYTCDIENMKVSLYISRNKTYDEIFELLERTHNINFIQKGGNQYEITRQ